MTTNKQAKAKKLDKANEAAINVFPKAKIEQCLEALAAAKGSEGEAAQNSANASLDLMHIAQDYGQQAHKIANDDTSTVLADWRENMRLVALEMAASGSPFAEASENKAGDTVAKLTGTGNNVMSIAKGVVDFKLDVTKCANEDGEVTYRTVRATVEAKRKERRDAENPELAKIAAAKDSVREAFKALTDTVYGTGDVGLINDLATALNDMQSASAEAIEAQAKIDAEAKAAAAAEAQAEADAKADAEADANPASDENIGDTLDTMAAA